MKIVCGRCNAEVHPVYFGSVIPKWVCIACGYYTDDVVFIMKVKCG